VLSQAVKGYMDEKRRLAAEEEARIRDAQRKEAARLADRANKWEEKGNEQKAAALREQAETMPVAQVAPEIPKVDGLHTRKTWKWELTDPEQLPRTYLVPDTAAIGAVVKAQGKRAEQTLMGSVTVWEEETVVKRAR
jgi:hypothetical protein